MSVAGDWFVTPALFVVDECVSRMPIRVNRPEMRTFNQQKVDLIVKEWVEI